MLATGPNLSLKSVIAKYLHERLQIGLIQSAYLGPIVDTRGLTSASRRARRRDRLRQLLNVYLDDGLPVLVDAAFHHRSDRFQLYSRLSQATEHINVMLLYCHSRDVEIREFRRVQRSTALSPLEVETVSSQGALASLREYESPLDDTRERMLNPILDVDTDHYRVEAVNLASHPDHGTLAEIVTLLRKAFATGEI